MRKIFCISLAITFTLALKNETETAENLFPLSIIHLNDFHARYDEINAESLKCRAGQTCIGGYGRIVTKVRELLTQRKNEGKNPIYLNIGDNFQGTLWYNLLGWNVTSHFLNMLNADAITLGNHEFDRDVSEVVEFLKHLESDVVVSNLDDSLEPDLQGLYKKSKIMEINGRKIGLVGALTVDTKNLAMTGELVILDEIESMKKESERLRDEDNVDIVIVLSHCGLSKDRRMARDAGSAIDVIVGAHSHDLLYNGESPVDERKDVYPIVHTQDNGHKVLIVQSSSYSRYIGDLTVYFDDAGEAVEWAGNSVFLDSSITPDPKVVEELNAWRQKVDEVGNREIGALKTGLNSSECIRNECNMANFVTDAYVDFFVDHPTLKPEKDAWTYATISMTTAGGFRTSLYEGSVLYDDMFTAFPFQDKIIAFELLGKDILDLLILSMTKWNTTGFIHFSGMKVVYNKTKDGRKLDKVVSVHVLCRVCDVPRYEELRAGHWYRMLAPEFLASGRNGYVEFHNKKYVEDGNITDAEAIELYVKKLSPVLYRKDGRLRIQS